MREKPRAEHPVRRLDDVVLGHVLGDDVAHALGARLGRERQPTGAHAGDLAQQVLVQAVSAQRRHGQRHLLGRQLGHGRLHQRRHARVVGHRQRRQRRLVVAPLLHAAHQRVQNGDRVALAHGAVDHARLAEPAPLGAATRHLDRHAVEDRLRVRQRRVVGEREPVDVRDQRAARAGRHARVHRRADDQEPALGVELRRVELGDVERILLGQADQPLAPRDAGPPQLGGLQDQRRQLLFRLADEERVDERRQRLRVRRGRTARQHQRRVLAPVGGTNRQTAQVQHRQHVRVGQLVLKREADHVEVGDRRGGLQRDQRQAAGAQLGLAVEPGGEDPLARDPVRLVEDAVEDLRAEVRHPDLVRVRERQADAGAHGRRVLADLLVLTPDVAGGLFDAVQEFGVWVPHGKRPSLQD